MRRVGREFVDVDAIVDDRSVASREPIPGDVKFTNSFRNEDQGINPAHGVAPDAFAVGVPVVIPAVTGVNDNRNTGQTRGCDCVMENQRVVSVENVGAIYAESGSQVENQAERKARGLSKRTYRHVCGFGFMRKQTGMACAVDGGLVPFGLLLAG